MIMRARSCYGAEANRVTKADMQKCVAQAGKKRRKFGEYQTKPKPGGGFKDLLFSPIFGEDSHFD